MKTLAIVAQKGGSGKSTIAVHLAAYANSRKLRPALIDLGEECQQDEIHLPGVRTEHMGEAGHPAHLGQLLRGRRRCGVNAGRRVIICHGAKGDD